MRVSTKTLGIIMALALVLALSISFLPVSSPVQAAGGAYYVDAVSGNDIPANGTSPGTGAWKTITYALNQVPGGDLNNPDVINVAAGTYDSANGETFPILFNKEGISLVATGAATIDGGSASKIIDIVDEEGITIEGFTITNSTSDATYGIYTNVGGYSVIDNIYTNVDYGIYTNITKTDRDTGYNMGDVIITGNDFTANTTGVYKNINLDFDDTKTGLISAIGDIDILGNDFNLGADNGVRIYLNTNDINNGSLAIGDIDISGDNHFYGGDYGVFFDGEITNLTDATVTVGTFIVDSNSFENQGEAGVYIDDYYYAQNWYGTTAATFGNLELTNNTIDSDETGCDGVHVHRYAYWEYFHDEATITAGDIRIEDNDPIDVPGDGLWFEYYYTEYLYNDASIALGDLYIQRNDVTADSSIGIYVLYEIGLYMHDNAELIMGDTYITDNTVDSGGYGIYLFPDYFGYDMYDDATVSFGNMTIEGNSIYADDNEALYVYGYYCGTYLYNNTVVTMGDIYIRDNPSIVSANDDAIYVYYDGGFYNDNDNGYNYSQFTLGDLVIEGNDSIDGNDYGAYINYAYFGYYNYGDSEVIIGGISIVDNVITATNEDGVYIQYYECGYELYNNSIATFGDVDVETNEVTAPNGDGVYVDYYWCGYYLNNNSQVTLGSVNITGNNSIDARDYGICVWYREYVGYELQNYSEFTVGDVNVQNNAITTVDDTGVLVEYDYGYNIRDETQWSLGSINIEGNDVTSTNSDAIYVYYSYVAAYVSNDAMAQIGNASIINNGIDAGGRGVYLEYYDVGYELSENGQVIVGNVDISGNHGVGDDTAPMTTANDGIYLFYDESGAYTYDYSTATFGDVTMQSNLIESAVDGIEFDYYEVGYNLYDSSDVVIGTVDISSNEIDAVSDTVYIEYEYVAYEMDEDDMPCEATLTMGDHSIYDNTFAGDYDGIYVYYEDAYVGYKMYDNAYAKLPSYSITGNTFNVIDDGIYFYSYDNPSEIFDNSTFDFGGILIDGNTFNGKARDPATPMDYGVYIEPTDVCYPAYGDSSTTVGEYIITNNKFYDMQNDAIYVYYDAFGSSLYENSTLQAGVLQIADNLIERADHNGITVLYWSTVSYDTSTLTMGNLDITGNDISGIVSGDGIYLYYSTYANNSSSQTIGRALIQDNIIDPTGARDGIYIFMDKTIFDEATVELGEPIIDSNIIEEWENGIYLQDVDGATITNNTITSNEEGIFLDGCDNIIISCNDILNNATSTESGVHLDADCGANTTINYNNIEGNLDFGVYNDSDNLINAESNWWGAATGPYDPNGDTEVPPCTDGPTTDKNSDGDGDHVSDNNVDYCPWLEASFAGVTITTASLPDGTEDTAYSETVEATGGVEPYTWSIDSGDLPDGLSLNPANGEISGTPTAAGTFDFTIVVTCDAGCRDTKELSILIDEPGAPPAPEPPAIGAVGGEAYPVNKVGLITPWITLAVVIAAGGFYFVRRRVRSLK